MILLAPEIYPVGVFAITALPPWEPGILHDCLPGILVNAFALRPVACAPLLIGLSIQPPQGLRRQPVC